MPALGRLPRAGRPAETGTVPRLGVLGQACAELWRADRAAADCRAGACGARGQSYRAHLHRRRFRRFPVRRAAPDGLLQPANLHALRRRATAVRCRHHRRRPLRPARQQTDPRRAASVLPLPAGDLSADAEPARAARAGADSVQRLRALGACGKPAARRRTPPLSARRNLPSRRRAVPRGKLPPQRTQHLHEAADPRNDDRPTAADSRTAGGERYATPDDSGA